MTRPNILLLVVDCLRADFVYQDGLAHTPAIASLCKGGCSFLNAIASTSTTTPSFASLLTGLYPFEHGVRSHSGYRLTERAVTLPQALQASGYHTYAEVSGPLVPEVGLGRGFHEYSCRTREETIHSEWGKRFLRKLSGHYKEPWFVLLHIWCLHKSRQVLPQCRSSRFGRTEYARSLASIDVYLERLFAKLPQDTLIVLTGDHGEDIAYGLFDRLQKRVRKKVSRYLVKHRLTSRHISLLYRGCHVGHGYGLYDTLVKVPLIFHCGPLLPRASSTVQVRHIDVAPTVLEAVGITPPPEMTGRSLMTVVRGEDHNHRDAYLEAVGYIMPNRDEWLGGMRMHNRYKYIYAPFRSDFPPQLYDLAADPAERHNIAGQQPEIAADHHARIAALRTDRMVGVTLAEAEQERVTARLKELGYLGY